MSAPRSAYCLLGLVAIAAFVSGRGRAVVGGEPISVRSAPWAVVVRVSGGGGIGTCSGAIIDASDVVTAAHCMVTPDGFAYPFRVTVVAGVSNFTHPAATDREQSRTVAWYRY